MQSSSSTRFHLSFLTKSVVIIPAHNEVTRIGKVLAAIKKTGYPCVVVDDGSTDDTAEVAKKYTPYVVRLKKNRGKSTAVIIGCRYAIQKLKAQALLLFDADGQHEAADIRLFFCALDRYPDTVISGYRQGNAWLSWVKKLGKWAIMAEIFLLFGRWYRDPLCGLRAFSAHTYKKLALSSGGYNLEAEILLKLHQKQLKLIELPIASLPEQTIKQGCRPIDGFKIMKYIFETRLFKLT